MLFWRSKNKSKQSHGSIYSSQHTKLGLKKYLKRSKIPVFILVSLVVMGGLYLGIKTVDNKLRAYFNPDEFTTSSEEDSSTEKNISFITKDKNPLSDSEQEYIRKKLNRSLSKKELTELSRTIKIKLALKQIHVLQTSRDSLIVSTQKLVPILSINIGKRPGYYISEDGSIYPSSTPYDLPEVKDLEIRSSDIEEDGYVFLTEDEYLLVSNVVNLYKELKSHNIDVEYIKYIKHRGLAFNIKNSQIDVIVGTTLFNEKLTKLEKILKNKSSSSATTLVELDYTNKAFITEKSL